MISCYFQGRIEKQDPETGEWTEKEGLNFVIFLNPGANAGVLQEAGIAIATAYGEAELGEERGED